MLSTLVTIHDLDYKALGLGDFDMPAAGATAMERCINWYWQSWEWLQLPKYERLVPVRRWLLDNAPVGGEVLTHGDSTLHNYMFVGSKLTSVLDWEMSCIGRRENDLALQIIGNELFAAPLSSGLPQPPSQSEWLERYERLGGKPVGDLSYYRRLTGFMVVIALEALQRNMSPEEREGQAAFNEKLWSICEA